MHYREADELAAERGFNAPDVEQTQAEIINQNINILFNIMRGVHNNDTVRNDSNSK